MIPIVLTTNNRPEYLVQVLTALSLCDGMKNHELLCFSEPHDEVISMLKSVDFMPTQIYVANTQLGCNINTARAINHAMLHYDAAVFLEDDIVPAKDFLNYMVWGLTKYADYPKVFSISAYAQNKQVPNLSLANKVMLQHEKFNPWGWGMWRNRWEDFIRHNVITKEGESWDCQFLHKFVEPWHMKKVCPYISRTQNIGEHGTYVFSPEFHHEHQYTPHWATSLEVDDVVDFMEAT